MRMAIRCIAKCLPRARQNWRSGCKKLRSADVLVRSGPKNISTRRVNGRQCEQEGAKTVASCKAWLLTEEHDFPADCRAGAAGGRSEVEHVLAAHRGGADSPDNCGRISHHRQSRCFSFQSE